MIPDEAVEAAAKWLHDYNCRSALHSGFPADEPCYEWRDEAKELLEAAAPHLMAAAWDEGADSEFQRSVMKRQRDGNPYRKATHGND